MSPLRRLLLRDLLTLFSCGVLALLVLSWVGFRQAVMAQARDQAQQSLELASERLQSRLQAHEAAAHRVGQLLATGAVDPKHPEGIHRALLASIPPIPGLRSLGICTPEGLVADIAPHAEGGWITEVCTDTFGRGTFEGLRWTPRGQRIGPLERSPTSPTRDVRQRPWYQAALAHPEGVWVEPFRFAHDTGAKNRLGLTYAEAIRDPSGRIVGLAEVSVLLEGIEELLRDSAPMPGSAMVLYGGTDLPLAESGPWGLSADLMSAPSGGALSWKGERYLVEHHPLPAVHGLTWHLGAALPERVLLAGPNRVARWMGLMSLACLLIVGWRIIVLAHRFSLPIRQLSLNSQAAAAGADFVAPATQIEEIERLGKTFKEASAAIRERAALEASLSHAQRVLTVGTLAGGIAHDVNNLLNASLLEIDLAQEPSLAPEDRERAMARAKKGIRTGGEVLHGLLGFGRSGPSSYRPLNLNRVVEDAAFLLRHSLGPRTYLHLALSPEAPKVSGDALQLGQVVMNLCVNARDAMPEGGRIEVETVSTPESVLLRVTDGGSGIPPEVQEHVFEPFFTTKAEGKGTGLGLAIVRTIVESHRGTVEVHSAPGRGSTFSLAFPPVAPEGER